MGIRKDKDAADIIYGKKKIFLYDKNNELYEVKINTSKAF